MGEKLIEESEANLLGMIIESASPQAREKILAVLSFKDRIAYVETIRSLGQAIRDEGNKLEGVIQEVVPQVEGAVKGLTETTDRLVSTSHRFERGIMWYTLALAVLTGVLALATIWLAYETHVSRVEGSANAVHEVRPSPFGAVSR